MKMAKASPVDIELAKQITFMLESVDRSLMPIDLANEEDEPFADDNPEHCIRVMSALLLEMRKGGLGRVTWGMEVLLDPANKIVDPDADTLEHHPERKALEQQVAELTRDRDEWKVRAEKSENMEQYYCRRATDLEAQNKELLFGAAGFVRAENDSEIRRSKHFIAAMQELTRRCAYSKGECAMLIAEKAFALEKAGEENAELTRDRDEYKRRLADFCREYDIVCEKMSKVEAENAALRDMADVGEALMKAIEVHADEGWHPADCPSEIVGDLQNELDEWKEAAQTAAFTVEVLSAELVELRQRLAEIDQQKPIKGATHCDNCGCTWLDDGLNPIDCPYCKTEVIPTGIHSPVIAGSAVEICGNCDTALPEGCGGIFKTDGKSCRLNADLAPLPVDSEGGHCD